MPALSVHGARSISRLAIAIAKPTGYYVEPIGRRASLQASPRSSLLTRRFVMQGDIVKAAKWLGGCMVVATLILVIGLHPTVTGRIVTFTKVQPEAAQSPSVQPPCGPPAYPP